MKTIWQAVISVALLALSRPVLAQGTVAAPLPPVDAVLKRAVEHSAKEDENDRLFNERYGYTRTKVTEYRNSNGDLKKREEKKSQNNPVFKPVTYSPPPAETKPRSGNDTVVLEKNADGSTKVRGKAYDKKDFSLSNDLFSRFQFTLAGREMVNGRAALVLDFKPRSNDLPERNIKDRFINKAAGRIWVDEEDTVLARADLHLAEKVNLLGGLVGAVNGFRYQFDRERTAEGLWFTRGVNWRLEGREVFVRRVIDFHEERSGVKKVW
jgi:hypothetical protein